ncbi:hypothetical protein AB0I27_22420 [Streptomyces sp. NPDC050597]|uniref:hypothetical protein n=1 Tax=Streptomyces sp. NPDC050597 TaxID=3157212 RepID=UPI00342AAB71
MPITHSDRISGTIYVIAASAERAGDRAISYLRTKTDDEVKDYGVFDEQDDAEKDLHNRYNSYDPETDRVYAVSLDIRIADEK